jgi:phospholipid transport system substrate-binding protein
MSCTPADFVANSYIGTLESYKGEKIVYLGERVDQILAKVDTRIVMSKGDPISVGYRLHLMAYDWKLYDVVINDISLVSNFRSQFSRLLAHGSFDELLRKMREKE